MTDDRMNGSAQYPGYDVLAKRNTPSWNDATRTAVDRRLAVTREPRFFDKNEFATLEAICDCIMPQHPVEGSAAQGPVPLAAYVDEGLFLGLGPGYRNAQLPPAPEAWRRGLAALDAECVRAWGEPFLRLAGDRRRVMLERMQNGALDGSEWGDMPPKLFFKQHVVTDIVTAFFSHPTAWSRIGYGGPASPRGYVRMGFDERDPWEASKATPGKEARAARENKRV